MDIVDKKLENIMENFIALNKYDNLFFKTGENDLYEKELFEDFMIDDSSLHNCNTLFLINNIIRIKEDVVDKIKYGESELKVFNKGEDEISSFNYDDPSCKFSLGTYKTNSFGEYISKIRNKLAHGDYYLDEGLCYLNIENNIVPVPSNLFLFLNNYLTSSNNYYRKEDNYQKNIIINSSSKSKVKKIDITNIDSILPLYTVLHINFASLEKNQEIKENIKDEFIKDSKYINEEFLDVGNKRDLELWQDKMIEKYNKLGVSISFENLKIKDKNVINLLHDYVNNNDIFKIQFPSTQKLMLGELIEKFYYFNYNQKFIITGNLFNKFQTDKLIRGRKNYKLDKFILDRANIFCNNYTEQLTSVLLAKFHVLYTCLLDDVFKENEEYKLDRSEEFDFSLLNLSNVSPDTLIINDNHINLLILKIEATKKQVANATKEYNKKNTCLTNLIQNNHSEEKINKVSLISELFKNKIELLSIELAELKIGLLSVENDLDVNKKYFENRAIIEGIRNSISHSNFTVNLSSIINTDVEKIYINFKDYDKDNNLVFDLDINLINFASLFSKENYLLVNKFVNNKIEERKLEGNQYTL